MPNIRAAGGPVFRTNALASSASGSLCQGPGIGLALLLTSNLNAMPGAWGNHFLENVFSPGPPSTKTFNELWGLILSERFPVVRGRTSPVLHLVSSWD